MRSTISQVTAHATARRRQPKPGQPVAKGAALPPDYTEMVKEVLTAHFEAALKALAAVKAGPRFGVSGAIFPDEILLSVSLAHEGALAATTVHASCDFDPTASAPKAEDLLAACVDAVGSVFASFLVADDAEKLEMLAGESLAAMEGVPFDWEPMDVNKRQIHLRVDKSNPAIETLADRWLAENDPDLEKREEEERRQMEKLILTPDRAKQEPLAEEDDTEDDDDSSGGQTLH